MTKSLYLLLFAVILFTSCKDEDAPDGFLSGTYENAGENTDSGIWYVAKYIFYADGTFELLNLLRESKSGDDLGYTSHIKGTYTLRGEEFSIMRAEMSVVNYEDFPEGYTERMEQLEERDRSGPVSESKGILKRLDKGKKISILFECNDMIGMSAMCIGGQIYDRVD